MAAGRKVVVAGSGGREHALALCLIDAPSVAEVIVVPGNAGTGPRHLAKPFRRMTGDVIDVARSERADLVVVGPEAPLCDGLVDELRRYGIRAYGPTKAGARLEGSKAFMKDFAARHGIRTARHRVVRESAQAERAVAEFAAPPVVKADGLCAGKGVVVAASHDEALQAARVMLSGAAFGDAGRTVVLEERIYGAEASAHAICDGERALVLPAAQDHKRIGEGDSGPNTGGMGTYAPAPLIDESLAARIAEEIFARALTGMAAEGTPYSGTLFAGVMVTPDGEPVLLEFNVRFGDPETQVLMNVIEGDLADALDSAALGALDPNMLRASGEHALCVVLAAHGYPGTPRTGDVIEGVQAAESVPGVRVYHAGTARRDGELVTAGGRVLGITGRGASLADARAAAYRAAELVRFDGMQLRRDIGARALGAGRQ
jgi:phosphoribosylamine--glycine ligase